MKREVAFKALVGSANYNLATQESDKDYKVFVVPTFADLYNATVYTESKVGDKLDEEFHDIRKLVNLLWKSNVNFLEVLFSTEITISENRSIAECIFQILAMKSEIATMNLPYLYKACKGMFDSKSKYVEAGNKGTHYLVEQYGFDTKSAMHAFRILDFIERFSENDFTDFKGAMQYDSKGREFMLNMKGGEYTRNQYNDLLNAKLTTFNKLQVRYMEQPKNETIKKTLDELIFKMIEKKIFLESNYL